MRLFAPSDYMCKLVYLYMYSSVGTHNIMYTCTFISVFGGSATVCAGPYVRVVLWLKTLYVSCPGY